MTSAFACLMTARVSSSTIVQNTIGALARPPRSRRYARRRRAPRCVQHERHRDRANGTPSNSDNRAVPERLGRDARAVRNEANGARAGFHLESLGVAAAASINQVSSTVSGIQRKAVDSLLDEPAREIGMIRRPLPADADVLAVLAAGRDGERQQRLDRVVALVERLGHDRRVAIEPERELRHVVGADRHAVEVLEVPLGEQRVRRQLAHHDDAQPVDAALEPVLGEQLGDLLRFGQRAHERHHDLDVRRAPSPRARTAARGTRARSTAGNAGRRSARRRGSRASDSPRAARTRGRRAGSRTRST